MHHEFRVERKILKLVGATIRTFGSDESLLLRAEQKGFKLREQVTFYSDDAKTQPVFGIKARQILDVSATYDIFDPNGAVIGYMQRKGLTSTFVRDEWECYGPQGQHMASVKEESSALGFLRRFVSLVSLIAPQRYEVFVNGETLASFTQNYNPLAARYQCQVDDRLAQYMGWPYVYAIPNMLAVIENKQG
ncbi:MAG: hypothetical protein AAF467_07550 [Actinomycetota bacterium]